MDSSSSSSSSDQRRDPWPAMRRALYIDHIAGLLGSFLDADAIACLYLALPLGGPLRQLWASPRNLASWGRRVGSRGSDLLQLRLDPLSPLLDLPAFLSFRHLHDHAFWEFEKRTQAFHCATKLFLPHPFTPPGAGDARMRVRACTFLPSEGPPPPFAGNLAVLAVGGQLAFYAPTMDGFLPTFRTWLQSSPHSLATSPGGTAILAAHDSSSVFVELDSDRVRCTHTGVAIDADAFLSACFDSETSFLTGDASGNVWRHPIRRLRRPSLKRSAARRLKAAPCDISSYVTSVESELLVDRRTYGPNEWPFHNYCDVRGKLALAHKWKTEDSPDCLLLAAMDPRAGLGHQLRLVFEPRLARHDARDDAFVYFMQSRVASLVVHPSGDSAFAVVVTKQKREDFFAPERGGAVVSLDGQRRLGMTTFGEQVRGVVGVYELRFGDDCCGGVDVLPRFYLDGVTVLEQKDGSSHRHGGGIEYDLYRDGRPYPSGEMEISAACGDTHLVVRLSDRILAHLPLASTSASTLANTLHRAARRYAFSDRHSFGVVFGARGGIPGLAACVKFNRFQRDVCPVPIKQRVPAEEHAHRMSALAV